MKYNRKNLGDDLYTVKNLHERVGIVEDYLYRIGFVKSHHTVLMEGVETVKCGSSLQKGELVYLFHILMEDGILYFDPVDKKRNRRLFQNFIEKNFTYFGEGGFQHRILDSSRHFSECVGFTYREKQLRYLEKIIKILLSKKEYLTKS